MDDDIPISVSTSSTFQMGKAPKFLRNNTKPVFIDESPGTPEKNDTPPRQPVRQEIEQIEEHNIPTSNKDDDFINYNIPYHAEKRDDNMDDLFRIDGIDEFMLTEEERKSIIHKISLFHQNIKNVKKEIKVLPNLDAMTDKQLIEMYDKVKSIQGKFSTDDIVQMGLYHFIEVGSKLASNHIGIQLDGPEINLADELKNNKEFGEAVKAWLIENTELFAIQTSPGMQVLAILGITALGVHNKNSSAMEMVEKIEVQQNTPPPIPEKIDAEINKAKQPVKPKPSGFTLQGGDFTKEACYNEGKLPESLKNRFKHL